MFKEKCAKRFLRPRARIESAETHIFATDDGGALLGNAAHISDSWRLIFIIDCPMSRFGPDKTTGLNFRLAEGAQFKELCASRPLSEREGVQTVGHFDKDKETKSGSDLVKTSALLQPVPPNSPTAPPSDLFAAASLAALPEASLLSPRCPGKGDSVEIPNETSRWMTARCRAMQRSTTAPPSHQTLKESCAATGVTAQSDFHSVAPKIRIRMPAVSASDASAAVGLDVIRERAMSDDVLTKTDQIAAYRRYDNSHSHGCGQPLSSVRSAPLAQFRGPLGSESLIIESSPSQSPLPSSNDVTPISRVAAREEKASGSLRSAPRSTNPSPSPTCSTATGGRDHPRLRSDLRVQTQRSNVGAWISGKGGIMARPVTGSRGRALRSPLFRLQPLEIHPLASPRMTTTQISGTQVSLRSHIATQNTNASSIPPNAPSSAMGPAPTSPAPRPSSTSSEITVESFHRPHTPASIGRGNRHRLLSPARSFIRTCSNSFPTAAEGTPTPFAGIVSPLPSPSPSSLQSPTASTSSPIGTSSPRGRHIQRSQSLYWSRPRAQPSPSAARIAAFASLRESYRSGTLAKRRASTGGTLVDVSTDIKVSDLRPLGSSPSPRMGSKHGPSPRPPLPTGATHMITSRSTISTSPVTPRPNSPAFISSSPRPILWNRPRRNSGSSVQSVPTTMALDTARTPMSALSSPTHAAHRRGRAMLSPRPITPILSRMRREDIRAQRIRVFARRRMSLPPPGKFSSFDSVTIGHLKQIEDESGVTINYS